MDIRRRQEPSDVSSWIELLNRYRSFLEEVGAMDDFVSAAFFLSPITTNDASSVERKLRTQTQLDADEWLYSVTERSGDQKQLVFALPSKRTDDEVLHNFPWVDVHSRLTAWWLVSAWRSLELSEVTLEQIQHGRKTAASACARSFLETVATHWADAQELAKLWDVAKAHVPNKRTKIGGWSKMTEQLWQIQYGGKFDEKVPDLKKIFSGALERKNALSHVARLAKAVDGDLQSDYQWLCNTVHPSIGATLAFSTPLQRHKTRTHSVAWFSASPLEVSTEDTVLREEVVESAMASAMKVGLQVALSTFEASLVLVDDVGLTTSAPSMATFPYWRSLTPSERNAPCPCRSGKRSKSCGHQWASPGPSIPTRFTYG